MSLVHELDCSAPLPAIDSLAYTRFARLRAKLAVIKRPSYVYARYRGLLVEFRQRRLLQDAHIVGDAQFSGKGKIRIGSRLKMSNANMPTLIDCSAGAELIIGSNASINYGVIISARQSIRIGQNVMIGNMSIISDTLCPMFEDMSPNETDPPESIEIGDDVWLAARVTVLPGARIGRGAVIGAGSIVKGRIPDHVVAIGNPARPIMRCATSKALAVGPTSALEICT